MKNWFWIFFLFVTVTGTSQEPESSKDVFLLDHFDDDALWPIYDGESVFNEVWGFVHNQQEYAVLGGTLGTYIFKITDENKLVLIDFHLGKSSGTHVVHRDYHDYKGYLYEVCDQGNSTLRVYDMQYLPDSIHVVSDDSALVKTAHNIFIDSSSALLYACGVKNQLGETAVKVISIANPTIPQLVYDFNYVAYAHDIFVRNDTAYVNAATEGLKVVNFSNPTFPIIIGNFEFYDDKGYNHSGWLSEDGKTYVMCDETIGMRFKVLDVSDPSNIKTLSLSKPATYDDTTPHNVMVKDGLAYFSYYNDGLQIYDIRHPNHPKRIAWFDSYHDGGNGVFKGVWGVYAFLPSGRILISDRKNGIYLLKFQPPPDLTAVDEEFGIYPNPIEETSYFYHYNKFESNYQFDIFTVSGKLMDSYQSSQDYLPLKFSNYASGMYLYRFYDTFTKKTATGKFVVP